MSDDTPARLYRPRTAPWGDYGSLLVHGLNRGRRDGKIQLERAGPYVPPITFAGLFDVVVTDGFRQRLEAARFRGITFREVVVAKVVRIDWRDWDLTAEKPREFPPGGEPENYILEGAHDPAVAASIGPLWELVVAGRVVGRRDPPPAPTPLEEEEERQNLERAKWLFARPEERKGPPPMFAPDDPEAARVRREARKEVRRQEALQPVFFRRSSVGDQDFFVLNRPPGSPGPIGVSHRVWQWLVREVGEHVAFLPAAWDEEPVGSPD
jgi:hypothetical protein